MADMLARQFHFASGVLEGCDEGAGDRERADFRQSFAAALGRDVLATFPAERIVLFTRRVSERRYDEGIGAEILQQRFGLPVLRAE
jgi:hypothetical protein